MKIKEINFFSELLHQNDTDTVASQVQNVGAVAPTR